MREGRRTRERESARTRSSETITACVVDWVTALRSLIQRWHLGCEGEGERESKGAVGGDVMIFVVLGCGRRGHLVGEIDWGCIPQEERGVERSGG